jgi:hypothetical protein
VERPDDLKVLSVVGAGRSGTTVLAAILGEVDGFSAAGELRWLWERGVLEQRPCGCGSVPAECPVWRPVIHAALARLGGRPAERDSQALAAEVVAAQHRLARWYNQPQALAAVRADRPAWADLQLVRAVTGAAVTAFAEATAARVVVDTSKRPLDAAVMSTLPGVEAYVVHLVRDPRAVVHSWRRRKTFTAAGQTRSIGTRSLAGTVRRWTANSLSAEALARLLPADRWLQMCYEDFATNPRRSVAAILALVGEPEVAPFDDEYTVRLGANHIVAGNPSRFTLGKVTIRSDDEWRTTLPATDRRLVTAATWPLMRHYGYPVRVN